MNGHLLWFRLWSEAVDDEKLRLLAFEDRWHFIALLCCKAQGLLDDPGELMQRKVAVKLGLQMRELDEVVRRLADVELVDQSTLQPLAWDHRQSPSDRSTERVRAWREKQRNGRETLQQRFETAPEAEAEAEADKDIARTKQQATPKKKAPAKPNAAFSRFWDAYPRKTSKATAEKAWTKIDPDLADMIIADVTRRRIDDPQWREIQYVPHPSTYLNQRRWEDEILTAEQAAPKPRTREQWGRYGQERGIVARPGESWEDYLTRLQRTEGRT